MPVFQNHAGFCLADNKIQLVEIDYSQEKFFLENVDEEHFDELFNSSEKEAKLINILQNAFKKLTLRKLLNCQNISFALHHNFFRIVELPYDNTLTQRDLMEHFNWELQLLFPSEAPQNYFIQFVEVNKSNIRKDKTAIIIAINKRLLNVIHKFCIANDMSLKIADNIHFAANAFITLDNPSFKNETFLSLMINKNDLSVIVLDEDKPVYFIVKKINESDSIIDILRKELMKMGKFNLSADSFSKCYLYGEVDDDLIDKAQDHLNLSLRRINPFDKIKIKPHLYENNFFIENYNSFAPATGVALRLL